jgi:stringent starvation protein B
VGGTLNPKTPYATNLPEGKLADFERFRGADGVVQAAFDARAVGVVLPERFTAHKSLLLNFGAANGKGDLEVNIWGIRETLRFGGVWRPVAIPWSAVYRLAAMTGLDRGRGEPVEVMVYPDSVPAEDAATPTDGGQVLPFRKKPLLH